MTHSLTLGSLLLTGDSAFADDEYGFWFEVCAEGTEFGEPESVTRIITSLLSDGAIVSYDSDSNRTVPVRVRVHGPTLAAVAHGEAALRRETKRNNELTWQPPDDFAPSSVYETYPSPIGILWESGWDLEEKMRRTRTVSLRLSCSPFARSAEKTVVTALTSGTTTVTIDACDSSTGWTATRNGAPDVASTIWEAGSIGVVELDNATGFPPETWTLTRTGAVDFTSTPYLEVEVTTLSAKAGAPLSVSAHLNGSASPLRILQTRRLSDGSPYFRVTFDTDGASASSITFKHTSAAGYGHTWQGLQVRNVARTDISPNITSHQLSRILEVGGTERTPASIHVEPEDGVSDLGITVVHTSPEDGSGYSPPLRRWRVDGGPIYSGDSPFSGVRETLSPAESFQAQVPTSTIPEGGYQLIAIMRAPASGVVTVPWDLWTMQPDGTRVGNRTGKVSYEFTANVWEMVMLAEDLTLPTVRTKSGFVEVFIGAGSPLDLDEAWMFRTDDDCALSYVNVTYKNLWLDSADQNSPVPTVWVGDSMEARTHPGPRLAGMGAHILSPDGTTVFAATAAAANPKVSAEFFKRWHSNAAE